MSVVNPLCGAPRIDGELLKLGIDVGQTTVAKYMARGRQPPSQGWKTFLRNLAEGIGSMDLFVVPTISFRLPTSHSLKRRVHLRRPEARIALIEPRLPRLDRRGRQACGPDAADAVEEVESPARSP
jgi:hypothetical protein